MQQKYIILTIVVLFIFILPWMIFLMVFKGYGNSFDENKIINNTGGSVDNKVVNTTGGSFENQWIKFNYHSNLTIEDHSSNDHIYINIYNGSKRIAWIYDNGINIDRYGPLPESTNTTINGRKALKDYDCEDGSNGERILRPSAAINLTDDSSLNIIFKPQYRDQFNMVINTLNIKKIDVKPNFLEKLQNDLIKEGPQNKATTGGKFENKWIKFEYPQNYTVTDDSTDNRIEIIITNGEELVGDITSMSGGLSSIGSNHEQGFNIGFISIGSENETIPVNTTIIAGRNAKTDTIFTSEFKPMPSANIELNPDATLGLAFQPGKETTYNQVIQTLIIKNDNIKPNILSDISFYLQSWYDFVKYSVLSFIGYLITFLT